jgi:outer membrane protein TolC
MTTQILLLQPLWTGGKIKTRHAQAQLGVSVAETDIIKSRQQAIFDVTQAYHGIQLTNDLEAALGDTAGNLKAIESLVARLIEQGDEFVTSVDLSRVRTTRLLVETDKVGVVRAREVAQAALRQAMGVGDSAYVDIAEPNLLLRTEQIELPDVLSEAMSQRPELRKARLATTVAELERKVAKAQYAPDIGLFSRFSTVYDDRNFPNPNGQQQEQFAVGIAGSVPLYAGGRRPAENRRAAWQQAQARQTVELVESLIALELTKAYVEYVEAGEQLPLALEAMQEANKTLEGYRNQYLGGFIEDANMPDYFEDLVASRFLLMQARSRYTQVVFAYNMSLARIRLASGSNDAPTDAAESIADDRAGFDRGRAAQEQRQNRAPAAAGYR